MSRDDAPHMAILDWQMPGLTGPELTTRLRELPREFRPT
jgi:CheY-like chemotaxis protein